MGAHDGNSSIVPLLGQQLRQGRNEVEAHLQPSRNEVIGEGLVFAEVLQRRFTQDQRNGADGEHDEVERRHRYL